MEELKQYSQNRLVSGTGNAKLTTLAHSRQTNSLPLEGLFRSVPRFIAIHLNCDGPYSDAKKPRLIRQALTPGQRLPWRRA